MKNNKLVFIEIEDSILEVRFLSEGRFIKLNVLTQLKEINELFADIIYDYNFEIDSEAALFFKETVQELQVPLDYTIVIKPTIFGDQVSTYSMSIYTKEDPIPVLSSVYDLEITIRDFMLSWTDDHGLITHQEMTATLNELAPQKDVYIREGESELDKKDKRSASVFRYKGRIIRNPHNLFKKGEE